MPGGLISKLVTARQCRTALVSSPQYPRIRRIDMDVAQSSQATCKINNIWGFKWNEGQVCRGRSTELGCVIKGQGTRVCPGTWFGTRRFFPLEKRDFPSQLSHRCRILSLSLCYRCLPSVALDD